MWKFLSTGMLSASMKCERKLSDPRIKLRWTQFHRTKSRLPTSLPASNATWSAGSCRRRQRPVLPRCSASLAPTARPALRLIPSVSLFLKIFPRDTQNRFMSRLRQYRYATFAAVRFGARPGSFVHGTMLADLPNTSPHKHTHTRTCMRVHVCTRTQTAHASIRM